MPHAANTNRTSHCDVVLVRLLTDRAKLLKDLEALANENRLGVGQELGAHRDVLHTEELQHSTAAQCAARRSRRVAWVHTICCWGGALLLATLAVRGWRAVSIVRTKKGMSRTSSSGAMNKPGIAHRQVRGVTRPCALQCGDLVGQ